MKINNFYNDSNEEENFRHRLKLNPNIFYPELKEQEIKFLF